MGVSALNGCVCPKWVCLYYVGVSATLFTCLLQPLKLNGGKWGEHGNKRYGADIVVTG